VPVTFEPSDPYFSVATKESEAFVPVLDPITLATRLRDYFGAANADLFKYITPLDDPDDPQSNQKKNTTTSRQQKFQLACIVGSLLDADLTLVVKSNQIALDDFIEDYGKQVAYRTTWQLRWCRYLVNCLSSRWLLLRAEAHIIDKDSFETFVDQMAYSHNGIGVTAEGRKLLEAHFHQPKYESSLLRHPVSFAGPYFPAIAARSFCSCSGPQ
jgi:hypothetical protein